MVAYNKGFSPLVYRYGSNQPVPSPEENVWDTVPFNNRRFCELFGIRWAKDLPPIGFNEVPDNIDGAHWSDAMRTQWSARLAGAIKFFRYCDKQYTKNLQEGEVNLERFQRSTYRGAPGREDWEWMWNEAMEQKGGLGDSLKELMRDMGCEGLSAYRKWRKSEASTNANTLKAKKTEFREHKVGDTIGFDIVWGGVERKMSIAVFGPEIVDSDGDIDDDYHPTTRALCYQCYTKDVKKVLRRVRGLKDDEEGLEEAYNNALQRPSIANLRTLVNYHETICFSHRAAGITVAADKGTWTDKIQSFFRELGAEIKDGRVWKVNPSFARANVVPWEQLRENVQAFIASLQVRIASEAVADDMPADEGGEEPGDQLFDPNLMFLPDAGVGEYANRSTDRIKADLGIMDDTLPGRPNGEDGKPPPEPTWPQWVGISRMVERAFTENLGEEGDPTLLADQVGMGKTIEVIVFIQILWQLRALQQANSNWPETGDDEKGIKWPKVLGNRKYFMGQERIPALPTIIVMQKGLVAQWRSELAHWVDKDQAHIFEYSGNDVTREGFFDRSSLFQKAMSESFPERTIVIAYAKSVTNEMRARMVNHTPSFARGDPCTAPPELLNSSLFGQRWMLGVVEEAHHHRVNGHSQRAMITLMRNCCYRIAVTATPVFTHPRDLLSICRILAVRRFIGDQGLALTRDVNSLIRIGEKEWDADPDHTELRKFLSEKCKKPNTDDSSSTTSHASTPILEEFILSRPEDIKSFRAFWSSRLALKRLRDLLDPVLIRRDERSVDPSGRKLIKYSQEIRISSWIALDERTEQEMLAMTSTKEQRDDGKCNLDGFFSLMKQILVHWLLRQYKVDKIFKEVGPEDYAIQTFPNIEAYLEMESPKLRRCIRIIKHHVGVANTNAPPLEWNKAGEEVTTAIELGTTEAPGHRFRRRKVVIYCHMRASWAFVGQALSLNGINNARINGTQAATERDKAVQEFQSEGTPDVILISDVAAAGLNLQRGSIVIFVDHPWSESEKRQIIGRVLRHGQDRQVLVYDLMVPDTSDEFLQGFAGGKGLMSGIFNRELSLRGRPAALSDSELESEDEPPAPKPKRSTSKRGTIQAPARPAARPNLQPKEPILSSKSTTKQPASKPVHGASASALSTAPDDSVNSTADDSDSSKPGDELTGDLSEESLALAPKQIKWKQVHPSVPSAGPKPRRNEKTYDTWVKSVEDGLKKGRLRLNSARKRAKRNSPKTHQPPTDSAAAESTELPVTDAPDQSTSTLQDARPTTPQLDHGKGKGKSKATATEPESPHEEPAPHPTHDLNPHHTILLQQFGNKEIDVPTILEEIQRQNLPPLPDEVMEYLTTVPGSQVLQGGGSGSSMMLSRSKSATMTTAAPSDTIGPEHMGAEQNPEPCEATTILSAQAILVDVHSVSQGTIASRPAETLKQPPYTQESNPNPTPDNHLPPVTSRPTQRGSNEPNQPQPTGRTLVPDNQTSVRFSESDIGVDNQPLPAPEWLSQELGEISLNEGSEGEMSVTRPPPFTRNPAKRPYAAISPPITPASHEPKEELDDKAKSQALFRMAQQEKRRRQNPPPGSKRK
ncbi:hypothetical protein FRC11_000687 [Ceratobasidium sp. 423]|nr:hypothetical protein FRC11_000687 [Ceratobasidium sp. 423]